jgi:branched-chain amino acid transport system permease protein
MILVLAIGVATGCVYALVAAGYSLIYRTTAVVNFAQGSYVMIGGLVTAWLYTSVHLSYPLAVVLGVLAATLTGLILWSVVVLPLWRRRSPAYVVLIETIIFGVIASTAMLLALGPAPQTLPPWFPGFALEFGGNRIDGQYLIVAALTLIALGAFAVTLKYTTLGRAMRACAASRETSALLGISPERVGAISFGITALLGGFGGAVIAPAQFASPDAGLAYGVFGFVAAVLGGFGSLSGALAGGILLGIVNALVGRYISSSYQTVISFGLLLVLLTLRPQGLFGRQWEES